MKNTLLLFICFGIILSCKNPTEKIAVTEETEVAITASEEKTDQDSTFKFTPISHATLVLQWNGVTMYIDPVGGADKFKGQDQPNLILITDIHGDHLNAETVQAVSSDDTGILVPQAVADKLPEGSRKQSMVINNGDAVDVLGFTITAIPMYNLPESEDSRHIKGRGNGYVIERDGKRVYISGDTEDIPEMRALKDIDIAFVCMNLPYTMTVESAADAVLEFAPATVYPFHYRGKGGLSDVDKFKEIVNAGNSDIEVRQLDWYAKK
jgi:L-ascorbate metabolism protein UlaG (beta-lactamase superfamily)